MGNERSIRAIRGATTVERDDPGLIQDATRELLAELVARNGIAASDIVSLIFTATPDLRSEFPARAARDLGWDDIPMLCVSEMPVDGALERCVRVLLHADAARFRDGPRHVYLRGARALRPDLSGG